MSAVAAGAESDAATQPPKPGGAAGEVRNIVVCCDGTGNTWSALGDTTVVKLFRDLLKDSKSKTSSGGFLECESSGRIVWA